MCSVWLPTYQRRQINLDMLLPDCALTHVTMITFSERSRYAPPLWVENICPGHQTDDEYHFMMTCEKYKADKDSLYSSIMRLSCPNIITLTNKAWKINLYIYGSWYRNTDHKMQSPPRCYGCRVWWCRHWDLCLDTRMMDHVEPNSCFMYYFAWKCLCIYM